MNRNNKRIAVFLAVFLLVTSFINLGMDIPVPVKKEVKASDYEKHIDIWGEDVPGNSDASKLSYMNIDREMGKSAVAAEFSQLIASDDYEEAEKIIDSMTYYSEIQPGYESEKFDDRPYLIPYPADGRSVSLSRIPEKVDVSENEVSGNDVSGNEVSGNDVSGNEVSGNEVSRNKVSANKVSANKVSGNKVSFNKVSSNKVSSDKVSSNKVSSNKAGTGRVSGNAVSTNGISENSISENSISGNSISQNGLSANGLSQNGLSTNGLSENETGTVSGGSPAVIVLSGGAYAYKSMDGSDFESKDIAVQLSRQGISAFVLHYRSNPYEYPCPWIDLQRAIRHLRFYAEDYGIDPEKISLLGCSAGGNLAGVFINEMRGEELLPEGYIKDEVDLMSDDVSTVALIYPVTTFEYNIPMLFALFPADWVRNEESREKLLEKMDLSENFNSSDVAQLICYGTADRLVDPESMEDYIDAAEDEDTDIDSYALEGLDHAFRSDNYIDGYVSWLREKD